MWVYLKSEPNLWTVGYYNSENEWIADSDWEYKEDAAKRVHRLNGGISDDIIQTLKNFKPMSYDVDDEERIKFVETLMEIINKESRG